MLGIFLYGPQGHITRCSDQIDFRVEFSTQSQFYTSINSQSVLIANPIRHFSLVFLCISVTGTGTEGGQRVGRVLISDDIHYRCISELQLYLLLFYFHQGFQDHYWSIYLKYSSSGFNACLLDLSKVLSRGWFNLHPEVDCCVKPVVRPRLLGRGFIERQSVIYFINVLMSLELRPSDYTSCDLCICN